MISALNQDIPTRYIAVEGNIGIGKSTVANIISHRLGYHLLLENYEIHPFLKSFYDNPQEYALETELSFILLHYYQLKKAYLEGLFERKVVSDFLFDKDDIFARITLKEPEYQVFQNVYYYIKERIPKPSLVIYLKSSPKYAMQRIQQRGREIEQGITLDYLQKINDLYDEMFERFKESPLIVLDIEQYDFISNEDHVKELISKIENLE